MKLDKRLQTHTENDNRSGRLDAIGDDFVYLDRQKLVMHNDAAIVHLCVGIGELARNDISALAIFVHKN